MAGIQIDGVNNKIDFDDDADTSISSNTDDTLVVESGGVNIASITAGEFAINEGSADIDFRVESNGNANMLMVNGGDDDVIVGGSARLNTANITAANTVFSVQGPTTGLAGIEIAGGSNSAGGGIGAINFINQQNADGANFDADGNAVISIYVKSVTSDSNSGDDAGAEMLIYHKQEAGSTVEVARIGDEADFMFHQSTSVSPGNGNTTAGQVLTDTGQIFISGSGHSNFNRNSDGDVMGFASQGTTEGYVSISGSTVSYGAFTGSHWSRLADNSKPTILRGTIMESLDDMCDWYYAEATVAETTGDFDKKVDGYTIKASIALPNGKSVGDAVTFTYEGKEHTGKYVKEDDVKHTKTKISDTADSKKVYGVFSRWDDQDDGLDSDVNDMEIAQVGTYVIRVNKDVTVSAGDLLVSNGDGTAKLQDDDIIRSKTVAKVNSNVKVETYSDGSYTVPCTLHC